MSITIETLYEDDDLLVVNKPAGLLVIPDRFDTEIPSLNKVLGQKLGQQVWVVHRLDKETSGAICFAKNETAHKYLSKLFMERDVDKYYIGLLSGRMIDEEGRIEKPIAEHPAQKGKMAIAKKGKPSITEYIVLEQWPLHSLVEFKILTGRTHQIRVHMQSIGHPIVCDELYGDGKPFFVSSIKKKYNLSDKDEAERPLLSRLALHSLRLEFKKEDGKGITVEAPVPKDISACIKQLNKWAKAV